MRTGLIPAHAGKTSTVRCASSRARAHPRSRGENLFPPFAMPVTSGSSPLTRGKPLHGDVPSHCEGLIPAHAGKTGLRDLLCGLRQAHPRSRGENRAHWWGVRIGRGSSPLTRGKPYLTSGPGMGAGLIPAHAGKTTLAVDSLPPH